MITVPVSLAEKSYKVRLGEGSNILSPRESR